MHPLLENFNIISGWNALVESEETTIKFLMDMGLIPPRNALLFCPLCGSELSASTDKTRKCGFRFHCKHRHRTPKCKGTVHPFTNTFFEGARIPLRDVLTIIICFVLKLPASFVCSQICEWRKSRPQDLIHPQTVYLYYEYCGDIAATQKPPKSDGSEKTDSAQETPSVRKSSGEKIYDFLIALRKIYPGPGKVGLEIKSLALDKSTDWEDMQSSSLE